MEIKNCEQGKSGDCCYCHNMAYEQLKAENEALRNALDKILGIVEDVENERY